MANQTNTSADAALLGPFENKKQWKNWEEKFVNYARSNIRTNIVPLSYAIRENEEPYINGENPYFINKTVALEGEYYADDRMSVLNMVAF